MSLIVAARFDTFPDVENAAQRLFSEGFTKQDVHVFYVNSAGEHSRYAYGGDRRSDPDSGRADMGAILGAALFGLAFAIAGGFIVAGLHVLVVAHRYGGHQPRDVGGNLHHIGLDPAVARPGFEFVMRP